MTTQVWPAAGVPPKPLFGSYDERLKSFNGEFQPDVGPPSRWPRSSKAMLEVSFRVFLTAAQRLALIDFWGTACKMGALPFTMNDPMSGQSGLVWFWAGEPAISCMGPKTAFNAEIRIRRFV